MQTMLCLIHYTRSLISWDETICSIMTILDEEQKFLVHTYTFFYKNTAYKNVRLEKLKN